LKYAYILIHDDEPIAFCGFSPPGLANSVRIRIFRGSYKKMTTRTAEIINSRFINLSRIVIDPRYRGAGIASDFVKACCLYDDLLKERFIELITSMGQINQFWKKAGFKDYGQTMSDTIGGTVSIGGASRKKKAKTGQHNWPHENQGGHVRSETKAQSKLAVMRYYLLDIKKAKGENK
jgi:GNAT superfamily N-acetyltransferase